MVFKFHDLVESGGPARLTTPSTSESGRVRYHVNTEIRTMPGDPLTTVHRRLTRREAAEPAIPPLDHRHQNDDAWSRPMPAEPVPAERVADAATDGRTRRYSPTEIEPRWRQQWDDDDL